MNNAKIGLLPSNFRESNLKNDILPKNEKLEWWFIKGSFKGIAIENRHFMCALFRQKHKNNKYGYALLLTLFNPKTKKYETHVQADSNELDLFISGKNILTKSNLYNHFIESYFDEIKRYGVPYPIIVEKSEVLFTTSPFKITWKNFSLKQKNNYLELKFSLPEQKKMTCLKLNPMNYCCSYEPDEKLIRNGDMAYLSYPRMTLEGIFEGKKVSGISWLDHQWGGYGYFIPSMQGGDVKGWDWFGINLNDGSDIWIMVQRNMVNKKILIKQLFLRKKNGTMLLTDKFTVKAIESWQSNRTRITYPIKWKIQIPELNSELTFEPIIKDQEIKLFSVLRAVWDGAGIIKGNIGAKKVKGNAWLELKGYGYIFDFQSYLDDYVDSIDKCLEKYMPKKFTEDKLNKFVGPAVWQRSPAVFTEMISKPVWDLLHRKGKHWRPIFGLLLLEVLGIDSKMYEELMSVILELSHSGALIIDDIQDESLIRRNEKCIHLKYGVDVAINAGNMLYFIPYLLVKDYPGLTKAQELRVYEIMVNVWVKAHLGQSQDIYWTRSNKNNILKKWLKKDFKKEIFEMYRYKTASAIEGVAELCSVIANVDSKTTEALIKLGRIFGVSYQIIDDVNNFSNSSKWTKVCAEDLISGKPTYPVVLALQILKGNKHKTLKDILCNKSLRNNPELLLKAVELIRESGSLEECRNEAKTMIEKEWKNFSKYVKSSEAKIMLRMMCTSLLDASFETS